MFAKPTHCRTHATIVALPGSNPDFVTIIKIPQLGDFYYRGGDEGIRTLDTLAGIPHFQCGALDQLCDISVSGYSAFTSSAEITPGSLSSKAASNSASISRNNGSSLPTSREASPSATVGVSLYD